MIKTCECPKCGEYVNNWYDNNNEIYPSDCDEYYIDYRIHCKCGCKFIYTEWYKLSETTVEIL